VRFLLHAYKPITHTMAQHLQERGDDAATARSLSMEARCVSVMFTDMDIVSLRSPGGETGSGDRLMERVLRRTGNGKAQQVPSPADVAGTADGHGVAGGIRGD
jgi:hypothetical protein